MTLSPPDIPLRALFDAQFQASRAQIVGLANEFHLSPLLMGWLFAALMRIATGSATVAMTTASGVVAPVALLALAAAQARDAATPTLAYSLADATTRAVAVLAPVVSEPLPSADLASAT